MKNISATFAGPTEKELPFSITSKEYEEIENRLKDEILKLINLGITKFYVSGETGINATCAQLIIYLRDEMKYDISLYPVITSKEITKDFNLRQLDDFNRIMKNATMSVVYHNKITRRTVSRRNIFVITKCNYLIAVLGEKKKDMLNMIKMAKRRKIHIIICAHLGEQT